MNNFLKILISLYFITEIYCSVTIVNEEQFNQLLSTHRCKDIKFKGCYDFLDEILLFKNALKNNSLYKEKIYISEISKSSNSKHTYQVEKNGTIYYMPLYILENNLSGLNKINKEHTISVGDEILVYHLFNKVFFAELLSTETVDIKYTSSINNKEGRQNIILEKSDWEHIKKKMGEEISSTEFDDFFRMLNEISLRPHDPCLLKFEAILLDNGAELRNFPITKASNYLSNPSVLKDRKIEGMYGKEQPLYLERVNGHFEKKNNIKRSCSLSVNGDRWIRNINNLIPVSKTNYKQLKTSTILEILTYWINLDLSTINTEGKIKDYKELFIIKLYEG